MGSDVQYLFRSLEMKREKVWLTKRDEIAKPWTKYHPFEID